MLGRVCCSGFRVLRGCVPWVKSAEHSGDSKIISDLLGDLLAVTRALFSEFLTSSPSPSTCACLPCQCQSSGRQYRAVIATSVNLARDESHFVDFLHPGWESQDGQPHQALAVQAADAEELDAYIFEGRKHRACMDFNPVACITTSTGFIAPVRKRLVVEQHGHICRSSHVSLTSDDSRVTCKRIATRGSEVTYTDDL